MSQLPDMSRFMTPESLHSREFNDIFAYAGPLGLEFLEDRVVFRLWAPTAERVSLLLFFHGEKQLDMQRSDISPGLWELSLPGDCEGAQYLYRLSFWDGSSRLAADPYARAVSVNGRYAVVLDAEALLPEAFSTERLPGTVDFSQISIYELHIRDMSIGPLNGISAKGKFLGLCESDTVTAAGNPSGLHFLKGLGISHIQLLPIYDFATVNEEAPLSFGEQYNWGYDPLHYNSPEGSYATDPEDPACRILELKTLIQTLHAAGFRVIMDVVYNHVYRLELSSLENTVPGYYFRFDPSGRPYNGTGCGNETASEQPMFRRYLIDSLSYWAKAYNLDGFRLDLMGIHDVETLQALRAALDKIDPNIFILGEGWSLGHHPEGVLRADQDHAHLLPGVAFFNDEFRNALRGNDFDAQSRAFLSGGGDENTSRCIFSNMQGKPLGKPYRSPLQNIIYSESHDNRTLYDKLKSVLPEASDAELERRCCLAFAIQNLSHGIVFFHAGQDLLRSKSGADNSYNLPDSINVFPYDRCDRFPLAYRFFRDLLKCRKDLPFLRQTDYPAIRQHEHLISAEAGRLHIQMSDGARLWHLFINARTESWQPQFQPEEYELIIHDVQLLHKKAAETLEIPPLSLTLLRLKDSSQQET